MDFPGPANKITVFRYQILLEHSPESTKYPSQVSDFFGRLENSRKHWFFKCVPNSGRISRSRPQIWKINFFHKLGKCFYFGYQVRKVSDLASFFQKWTLMKPKIREISPKRKFQFQFQSMLDLTYNQRRTISSL